MREETLIMAETKGRKRRPGRPKGTPTKSASFRLPANLLEELSRAARAQDRSQTTLMRRALEAYLKDHADDE